MPTGRRTSTASTVARPRRRRAPTEDARVVTRRRLVVGPRRLRAAAVTRLEVVRDDLAAVAVLRRPCRRSSRIARSQSWAIVCMLCETKITVRPDCAELLHPAEAAPLELGVADGEHLVDEQDLGLEVRGDREREAHVHAARVALDRRVEEPARRPENSTISSNLPLDLASLHPEDRPFRKTFSRPVSSGWKPVPTSSRLPTRPRISARARWSAS